MAKSSFKFQFSQICGVVLQDFTLKNEKKIAQSLAVFQHEIRTSHQQLDSFLHRFLLIHLFVL